MEEEEILEEAETSSEPAVEEYEEEEYAEEFSASELESFMNVTDLWIKALKDEISPKELASTIRGAARRTVRRRRR